MKEETKELVLEIDALKGVEHYSVRLNKIKNFLENELKDESLMQSSINERAINYENSDDQDCYFTHEYRMMNFEIMLRIVNEYYLYLKNR